MIETALITFRESLEAFLVIAIMIAYLCQTNRRHLLAPVYIGVVIAIGLSAVMGYAIEDTIENPATEAALALTAGFLVATMTYHVMRTARGMKKAITNKIDHHSQKSPLAASIALFLFTILMVSREGMETALMLGTMAEDVGTTNLLSGALCGVTATAFIGYLWVKKSHLINLKLFLQTTGIFLIIFAAHLFILGLHELSEINALPFVDNVEFHTMTESFDDNSPMAKLMLYGMVAVPCLWLAVVIVKDRFRQFQVAQS